MHKTLLMISNQKLIKAFIIQICGVTTTHLECRVKTPISLQFAHEHGMLFQ